MYAMLVWTLFHSITKICKPQVVYQFNAWRSSLSDATSLLKRVKE